MRMMSWVLAVGLLVSAVPVLAEGEATGEVAKAVVTTGINERAPVDEVGALPADASQVYFFTDVRGMNGQRITHRWEHNGEVLAEVGFDVKAARWRVWSSKTLITDWHGAWKISVVDGGGNVLTSREFTYGE